MYRLVALVLTVCLVRHVAGSCQPPWYSSGTNCYLVVRAIGSNLTWNEARQTCVTNYGGDLVSISSQAEQTYVQSIYKQSGSGYPVWIGVNDRVTEGLFVWSDGSGNVTNNGAYTNWMVGEPNDASNEDCGAMTAQGTWNDLACTTPNVGYICKRLSSSTLPTPGSLTKFTLATTKTDCGGWYKYAGYCYQYYSTAKTFNQAEAACFGSGATLLSILSTNELNYIKYFISQKRTAQFYLGLNDRLTEGTYVWDDGTITGQTSKVQAWGKGEPNDNKHSEDCAEFLTFPTLTWNDIPCGTKRAYMCKRKASSTGKFPPITAPVRTKCPSGYSPYSPSSGARYCYKLAGATYSQRRSWYQARSACTSAGKGFDLASIHDHNEANFISRLISNKKYTAYYFWIGLNDRSSEGGYVWSDGTPTDYVKWATSQPNNLRGRQDCTEMYRTSGSWNDNSCSGRSAYICKYTLVPRPAKAHPTVTTRYCQTGWLQFGSYCYYVKANTNLTHAQAVTACNGMTANLTSINSYAEQAFIMSGLGLNNASARLHIGINDIKVEGEFTWSDGSLVTFTNWGYNQPNDWRRSQDCTELDHTLGYWNDISCNGRRGYVCKRLRDQVTQPAAVASSCPKGWQAFKGMCYLVVVNSPKTQSMAENFCKTQQNSNGLSGHLATISSRYVNFFLSSLVTANVTAAISASHAFWFGLNDVGQEGQYLYTSKMPITYTNWARGQPNNWRGGQNCVEMWSSTGVWNDNNCSTSMPFICSIYNNTVKTVPFSPTPPCCTGAGTCAAGWVKSGSMCYGFFGTINSQTLKLDTTRAAPPITALNWVDAQASCASMGGNLATIPSSAVQKFLVATANTATKWLYFWIGLNDRNDEGGFVWADGSPVTYTNWSTHQPNDWNGAQDCVEVLLAGSSAYINTWNDLSCANSRPFICEYPAGKQLPPSTAQPMIPPPGKTLLTCPSLWTSSGDMCYQVQPVATTNTFTNAELKCKALSVQVRGALPHLAAIHSPSDHLVVARVLALMTKIQGINNTQFWIGLHDRKKEGTFVWTDNSTVNYQGWSSGQPNNWRNRQDCTEIRMDTGYGWNDQSCSNVLPYVCGFSRVVSASTIPTQPPPFANLQCNPGWKKYQSSCYKEFSYPRLDWSTAYLNCSLLGGDLLVVNSKQEQYFVTSQVTSGAVSEYVWLGLSDQDNEGYWRWADGTTLVYNRWGPQQPNNYQGQDCVAIHSSDNMWYDRDCSEPHSFVCEVPIYHFNYTSSASSSGLSAGSDAGIAIAVILAIAIIGVIIFLAVSGKAAALKCSFLSRANTDTTGFSPLNSDPKDDDDDDDALLSEE